MSCYLTAWSLTHTHSHKDINTHFIDRLTLCLGTHKAGGGVSEGAQHRPDGQAQVLVTRVQSHRGEAKVRQLWVFLRTDLYVRDLKGSEGEEEELLRKTNVVSLRVFLG